MVQATGGTEEKARHLSHSEDSDLYTDKEKAVIAYAKELAQGQT